MPSRMTQESYRPGVSDRTMVGNSATTFAYEFQRTEWRRHESEHETIGMGKKHRASSLRGLQGRSATNQNGQAAEEKKTKGRGGLDAPKAVLASSSGGECFSLDIPLYRTSESPTTRPESSDRSAAHRCTGKSGLTLYELRVRTKPWL